MNTTMSRDELYGFAKVTNGMRSLSLTESNPDILTGDLPFEGLSVERLIVNVPDVFQNFSTKYYPQYLVSNMSSEKFDLNFESSGATFPYLTESTFLYPFGARPSSLSDSSVAYLPNFANLNIENKKYLYFDIINSLPGRILPKLSLKKACIVKDNVSAYAYNVKPESSSDNYTGIMRGNGLDISYTDVDSEHNLNVKCKINNCKVIVRLCSSSIDTKTTNAFEQNDKSADCFITYRIADSSSELQHSIISPSGTIVSPNINTEPSYNSAYKSVYLNWFFKPSTEYPGGYTTKLFTGKAVACIVGGDFDFDTKVEDVLTL